jgi:hypothetical protein
VRLVRRCPGGAGVGNACTLLGLVNAALLSGADGWDHCSLLSLARPRLWRLCSRYETVLLTLTVLRFGPANAELRLPCRAPVLVTVERSNWQHLYRCKQVPADFVIHRVQSTW